MDILQQRIIEIALQIPGYLGDKAKECHQEMEIKGKMYERYSCTNE